MDLRTVIHDALSMLMMSLISWQRTFLTEDEKPAARCTGPLGSSGARGDHCRTLPVFKVPRARTVARARVVLRPQSVSVFRTTARRYHQGIRSLEEGGGRRRSFTRSGERQTAVQQVSGGLPSARAREETDRS